MSDSGNDSDNELESPDGKSLKVSSLSCSLKSIESSEIPLPETNEENDSYSARLITFIFNKEKSLIEQLQISGTTKYMIDRKSLKPDDTLIKNLWTLLCVISCNAMSVHENKSSKFDYYIGVANKFEETFRNLKLNSFF